MFAVSPKLSTRSSAWPGLELGRLGLGDAALAKIVALDEEVGHGRAHLHDAVPEVGGDRGFDHPRAEPARLGSEEVLEQPDAVAEEHGDEVDLKLVEQPGLEVLLGDARAAADRDVLVARGRLGLLERGLDAVGDEGEGRSSLLGHRLAGVVGEDEHRVVEGGSSPHQASAFGSSSHGPSPPLNIRLPITVAPVSRSDSSMTSESDVGLAAGEAMALAPALGREGPLMELLAALAQRLVERLVWPRDEAVERHRDVEGQLCQRGWSSGRELSAPETVRAGGAEPA